MKTTPKADGTLICFPLAGGGRMTFSADQLERMPKKRLAALRKLIHATAETTYPKTSPRRRRKTFADGSQVIESSSGYEIFEGIPKPKKSGRKAKSAPVK